MRRVWFWACLPIAMLLAAAVSASASSLPPELAKALQRLAGIGGFSCRFEQRIRFHDGGEQVYRGSLAVQRPGRFRWRYDDPYVQVFIGDGRRIWHYEPDLEQVTVLSRMQGVDAVVMRLLDGRLRMGDIRLLAVDGHRYRVRLAGRRGVWLGIENGRLAVLESLDTLGNRNRIRLLSLSFRPPPPATFVFTPPPGVDVVFMGTPRGTKRMEHR